MKLLKKEMNRRDFLKFSLIGLLLFGLGSLGLNFNKNKDKNNDDKNNIENLGYGSGVYGG